MKEVSHKRTNIVWSWLYEMARIGKITETEIIDYKVPRVGEFGRKWAVIAKGNLINVFWGDEKVLKIDVVMFSQFWEYTKNQWMVHIQFKNTHMNITEKISKTVLHYIYSYYIVINTKNKGCFLLVFENYYPIQPRNCSHHWWINEVLPCIFIVSLSTYSLTNENINQHLCQDYIHSSITTIVWLQIQDSTKKKKSKKHSVRMNWRYEI